MVEEEVVYCNLPPSPTENTSQFTHRSRLEYTTKQLFVPGSASGDPTISRLALNWILVVREAHTGSNLRTCA